MLPSIRRHYKVLYTIFALCLPTLIPIVFWGEDPIISLFTSFFTRTILNLNATWLVNSAAHLYGTRPFDKWVFNLIRRAMLNAVSLTHLFSIHLQNNVPRWIHVHFIHDRWRGLAQLSSCLPMGLQGIRIGLPIELDRILHWFIG